MFSIKQFIINLSSEARQELRKLINEIEGNTPAVPEAEAQVEQAQDVQPAKDNSTEAPSETPAA